MTPESFVITCKAIFPYAWQTRIGPFIKRSRQSVIDYAEGRTPVPEDVILKLDTLLKQRIKDMTSTLLKEKENE